MKADTLMLICALLAWAPAAAKAKALRVVATTPDLVDIVKRVGGGLVSVEGIARGPEDIHQVVMRPSFVTKLNKADAVVYLGLGVEHSFLPGLLDVARNPKLRTDVVKGCIGTGCIDCSGGLSVLEQPDSLSRSEGEIHPMGNPHYNMGPDSGALIARNVAAGLTRMDPAHGADYAKNLEAYLEELDKTVSALRSRAAQLRGLKAVSYHKDVAYFGRFTGLEFVGQIEPKPGVPPTPTHLAKLVEDMKAQGVGLVVCEQQYSRKNCDWLAERTGAKVAVIGEMGKALPGTGTFAAFSTANVEAVLKALGKM